VQDATSLSCVLHDVAADRDAAHHLSVGERESLAVDKWLTKCKIDKPDRFSGESARCGEHVKSFLSEVKRYLVVTGLACVFVGRYVCSVSGRSCTAITGA